MAFPIEHHLDARQPLEKPPDVVEARGIADVHVRQLVIGNGKRRAGARVQRVGAELVTNGQPTRLAQRTIDVHRPIDIDEAVLGEHDHAAARVRAGA